MVENCVESHQNSEVQEDADQLKKAVGDCVESHQNSKKGVESHQNSRLCRVTSKLNDEKLPGPVKCELKKV